MESFTQQRKIFLSHDCTENVLLAEHLHGMIGTNLQDQRKREQKNIKKRGGEINAADQPWAQPEEKAFPS